MAFDRNSTSGNGFDDGLGHFYSGMPINNFCFSLRVEGIYNVPLKSVKSIAKKNSYEPIIEGGLNDYPHMKRKQVTEPYQFQVERYVTTGLLDPLSNGAILTLPVLLFIWKQQDGMYPEKVYAFTGCQVAGKEYGELNAERSGLMVETITIMFEEMYDIPARFWDKGSFTDSQKTDSKVTEARKKDETSAKAAQKARDEFLARIKKEQEAARERQRLLDEQYAAHVAADDAAKKLDAAAAAEKKAAEELSSANAEAKAAADSETAAKKALADAEEKCRLAAASGESEEKQVELERAREQAEADVVDAESHSKEAKAAAESAKKASDEAAKDYKAAADAKDKADEKARAADKALSDFDKKKQ